MIFIQLRTKREKTSTGKVTKKPNLQYCQKEILMPFLAKNPSQSKVAKEPIGVSFGPIFTPKDVHKSSKNQKKILKIFFQCQISD